MNCLYRRGTNWAVPSLLTFLACSQPIGCTRVVGAAAMEGSGHNPSPPALHLPTERVVALPGAAIRRFHLGNSVHGAPLVLQVFGNGAESVFIFGGIHGSEPTSAALAERFAEQLYRRPDVWADRTVGILTAANPDGLAAATRANANGVDLNRNFPARNWRPASGQGLGHGPASASEPETRAIMRALEFLEPDRILSIHSIARGRHCNNFDGPAEHIADAMARHNRYPVEPSMGYPTPGSFGSWAGIDLGIPTITLELPREAGAAECWYENVDALLAFVRGRSTGAPPP